MEWQHGGRVNDQEAVIKQRGCRVEALHGGRPGPDKKSHGHIVSNDDVNARLW